MSKAYKDMTNDELEMERLRLKVILMDHPKPIAYKQAKKSLEKVNKLIIDRVVERLKK